MKNVGQILKAKREEKRLTVEAVHQRTFIPLKYIRAIEEGNLSPFPAEVYFVGSLKRYAQFLGLDGEELVRQYRAPAETAPVPEKQPAAEAVPAPKAKGQRRSVLNTETIIAVVVAAALVAAGAIALKRSRAPGLSVAPQSVSTAPVAAPLPQAALRLEIRAQQASWVRVNADGTTVYEGLLRDGESRQWGAQQRFSLVIGNAPGVVVTLNDRPVNVTAGAVRDMNELTLTKDDVK